MLIVNVVDFPFPVVVVPSTTPRMGESLTEFITHPSCYISFYRARYKRAGDSYVASLPEGPHLVHVGSEVL